MEQNKNRSSLRRKGAARHLIWFGFIAHLSQWGGGGIFACSNDFYQPLQYQEEGRGEGISTLWVWILKHRIV
jgi:hypothetical protein